MSDTLHVLFTMDVEPVTTGDGRTSGPKSNAEGARRVREYARVLDGYGLAPTFFVHPELGAEQADLFLELREAGADAGLHLHAAKFAPSPGECELGGLDGPTQRRVLAEAADMFADHFGFRPDIFRPGCFSANDATCSVLCELGFVGGGVSIPGRVWPERFCVWAGSGLHPRRPSAAFRQADGALPFVDVPLSVDADGGLLRHALGFDHYADLRPGGVYEEEEDSGRDHRAILRRILERIAADDPPCKALVVDVHNDRDFVDPSETSARQLRTVLEAIPPECERLGLRPESATVHSVIARFDAESVAS